MPAPGAAGQWTARLRAAWMAVSSPAMTEERSLRPFLSLPGLGNPSNRPRARPVDQPPRGQALGCGGASGASSIGERASAVSIKSQTSFTVPFGGGLPAGPM